MKFLKILPALTLLSGLAANCRGQRPLIEADQNSKLSQVTIGDFNPKDGSNHWSTFQLKLERLRPTPEVIQRSYQRPLEASGFQDSTVQVAYGNYHILLSYADADGKLLYESCASEKAKEHAIKVAEYLAEIQICSVGSPAPVGVVEVVEAEVTIKPVMVPPVSLTGSFVEQHGALTVQKNQIVDKNKLPVQLKGMSLFWSQWTDHLWNKEVVATLSKDWKSTVVRAAMGVEEGGYLTHPEVEKARVKLIVDEAIAQGIYVIIDWHDHNAHNHTAKAVEFFSEMATLYGKTPNVIFEVYNEPIDSTWAEVKAYAETVIRAIRAKQAKNLVIVGSPTWSQRVDQAADNPVQDTNVAYALHFYAATHRQELRDKATYAINKGLALFVTEFGTCESNGSGVVDLVETELWMKFMAIHKISWANWSLNDKAESASALKLGVNPRGPWANSDLTESGVYIRKKISE